LHGDDTEVRPGLEGLPAGPQESDLVRVLSTLSREADQLASLKARVDTLTFSSPPQRRELVALLSVLQEALGPLLDTHHRAPDGFEWVAQHPATEAVGFLADALRDLDIGVTPPLLKAPKIGGAMKPKSESDIAARAVDWVRVVQTARRVSQQTACKQVAAALVKMGVKVGRKPIDATRVKGWCAGRGPGAKR
jgi:hypothetical protein